MEAPLCLIIKYSRKSVHYAKNKIHILYERACSLKSKMELNRLTYIGAEKKFR